MMPHENSAPSFADPPAPPHAAGDAERPDPSRPKAGTITRPSSAWGVPSALAILAVGSILTFTVGSSVSGVSLSEVGVIVMLVALAALTGLLVRAVFGLRRHGGARTTAAAAPEPGPPNRRELGKSATSPGSRSAGAPEQE